MWIETGDSVLVYRPDVKFIRQQWRMWIETQIHELRFTSSLNSFASNGECGLKQSE